MKQLLKICSLLFLIIFLGASTAQSANLKKYYVVKELSSDYKIIVEDAYGDQYLVEYGIGCLSMWRYEGKYIHIDVGGAFLDGIGDRIYLFDSDADCRVFDVDELSGGGYSSSGNYSQQDLESGIRSLCSSNATYANGTCICNNGYVGDGVSCITYTQDCINSFGQNVFGVKGNGNNSSCSCNIGYQWNSLKTACVKMESSKTFNDIQLQLEQLKQQLGAVCPQNSTPRDGQCFCNEGYGNYEGACLTYDAICIKVNGSNVVGSKNIEGKLDCNCVSGFQWDSSQKACVKIENTPAPVITKNIETKEETKELEQKNNNIEAEASEGTEQKEDDLEAPKEEKPHESFISWRKIFSPVKNLWNWLFKR